MSLKNILSNWFCLLPRLVCFLFRDSQLYTLVLKIFELLLPLYQLKAVWPVTSAIKALSSGEILLTGYFFPFFGPVSVNPDQSNILRVTFWSLALTSAGHAYTPWAASMWLSIQSARLRAKHMTLTQKGGACRHIYTSRKLKIKFKYAD